MEFLQQIFRRYIQKRPGTREEELVDRWYSAAGDFPRPRWLTTAHRKKVKQETWRQLVQQLELAHDHLPTKSLITFSRRRLLVRYAAAAAITGVVAWGVFRWAGTGHQQNSLADTERKTYTTGIGTRKKLTLPDGTIIWMNNGTSVSIAANYTANKTREIWLADGEAWFEVAKDPQRPFIVHVDTLQTRVLGTAFTIQAYRRLRQTQIRVAEGTVQVSLPGKILDTLQHDAVLSYQNHNGNFLTTTQPVSKAAGWWNHQFILDKASFEELRLRLALRYDVTLESSHPRILQASFTAHFSEDADLHQVLKVLTALYNTHYTKKGNRIIIY